MGSVVYCREVQKQHTERQTILKNKITTNGRTSQSRSIVTKIASTQIDIIFRSTILFAVLCILCFLWMSKLMNNPYWTGDCFTVQTAWSCHRMSPNYAHKVNFTFNWVYTLSFNLVVALNSIRFIYQLSYMLITITDKIVQLKLTDQPDPLRIHKTIVALLLSF